MQINVNVISLFGIADRMEGCRFMREKYFLKRSSGLCAALALKRNKMCYFSPCSKIILVPDFFFKPIMDIHMLKGTQRLVLFLFPKSVTLIKRKES